MSLNVGELLGTYGIGLFSDLLKKRGRGESLVERWNGCHGDKGGSAITLRVALRDRPMVLGGIAVYVVQVRDIVRRKGK